MNIIINNIDTVITIIKYIKYLYITNYFVLYYPV